MEAAIERALKAQREQLAIELWGRAAAGERAGFSPSWAEGMRGAAGIAQGRIDTQT